MWIHYDDDVEGGAHGPAGAYPTGLQRTQKQTHSISYCSVAQRGQTDDNDTKRNKQLSIRVRKALRGRQG